MWSGNVWIVIDCSLPDLLVAFPYSGNTRDIYSPSDISKCFNKSSTLTWLLVILEITWTRRPCFISGAWGINVLFKGSREEDRHEVEVK